MKASRGFWITIAALLIATAIYYPFSPGGAQRRNMKRAEQHILTLTPLVADDPRFTRITFGTSTARGGCLTVFGEVASQEDAEALRVIVMSSQPPTEVFIRPTVKQASDPASQPTGVP